MPTVGPAEHESASRLHISRIYQDSFGNWQHQCNACDYWTSSMGRSYDETVDVAMRHWWTETYREPGESVADE